MRRATILFFAVMTSCHGSDEVVVDSATGWDGPPRTELLVLNSGGGRVVSTPEAIIDCGTGCEYVRGSGGEPLTLSLAAEPLPGRGFLGWGGDCQGTASCELRTDADHVVWPTFTPPTPAWARSFGGTGDDTLAAVAIAPDEDIVVVGWVAGEIDLDGTPSPGLGGDDILIVKLSPTGATRWTRRLGGTGEDRALATAIAADGTIYVTGYFSAQVDLGSGPVVSNGLHDIFVLALAADGSPTWARAFGGFGSDEGRAIVVSDDGALVAGGSFENELALDGVLTLTSTGGGDGWVAKLDALGAPAWGVVLGGPIDPMFGELFGDKVVTLARGSPGTVLAGGHFETTVDFGVSIETAQDPDGFVCQLSVVDGAVSWVRRISTPGDDSVSAITRLPSGEVVAAATFYYDVSFGGVVHTSHGINDIMVARMDGATGAEISAFVIGGTMYDVAHGIAFDPRDESVVVTGFDDDVVQVGDEALFTYSGALVARYNLDGTARWGRLYGSNFSHAFGVAVAADGRVVVAGSYESILVFGQQRLMGLWNGFVLSLGND